MSVFGNMFYKYVGNRFVSNTFLHFPFYEVGVGLGAEVCVCVCVISFKTPVIV